MEQNTETGLERLYRTRGGRRALAALLTLAALALLLPFCQITYLNNDDANIARALSGSQTGTPFLTHPFIHFALGACVSACYRILPAVPWWTAFQLAFLLLGMCVTGTRFLSLCEKNGLRARVPCFSWPVAVVAVYGYAVCQIAFTLTSAVLGAAGVAVFMTMERGRGWARDAALGVCLAVLCFFVRNSGGRAMLPFWGLALGFRAVQAFFGKDRRAALRLCGTLGALACAAVLTMASYRYGFVRWNAEAYPTFDEARSGYLDYPVDDFADSPQIYEAAGWDGTLAGLAKDWFFMDGRVTTEALTSIAAQSKAASRPAAEKLRDAFAAGVALARGNGQMLYLLTAFLAVLTAAAFGLARRRAGWPDALALACFGGGAFVMCLYLGYAGRFLLRTFEMLAYPAFTGMLLCAVRLMTPEGARSIAKTGKRLWLAAALLSAALLLWGTGNAVRFLTTRDASAEVAQIRTLKAYVSAHPENLYIRDTSASGDIDAFPDPAHATLNLLDWGGTGMYTGAQAEQLRANGLSALDMTLFSRDGVYFVTTDASRSAGLFAQYCVQNGFGAPETVETLAGGIRICRIP